VPPEAHLWLIACGYTIALAAMGYSIISAIAIAARRLDAPKSPTPAKLPGVTVLKPLCGAEPETYECLRSFCDQIYPQHQVVFGVSNPEDPVIFLVKRLQREFPKLELQLSIDRRRHGNNPKVSNLINMLSLARHDFLVVADSDVRVQPQYLSELIPPLLDLGVGIVTCCYRGIPRRGFWSLLGSMYINEWFMPSVRVAALGGYRSFAFGATIAIRRETLAKIGGFSAICDQLADDYRLGEMTRRLGLRTVLSSVEVDTIVRERTASALIAHELRWRRTIRNLSPLGYAFSFVTLGLPVTALQLILSRGAGAATAIFAITAASSAFIHLTARTPGRARSVVFLVPFRDLLHFALWIWSFVTRHVQWREDQFLLRPDGAAQPIEGLSQ
jgi:ceramide glucosyltransferase